MAAHWRTDQVAFELLVEASSQLVHMHHFVKDTAEADLDDPGSASTYCYYCTVAAVERELLEDTVPSVAQCVVTGLRKLELNVLGQLGFERLELVACSKPRLVAVVAYQGPETC